MESKIEKLKKKYKGEWLAIKVTQEKEGKAIEGELIAHCMDRRELHQKIRERGIKSVYFTFAGPVVKPGWVEGLLGLSFLVLLLFFVAGSPEIALGYGALMHMSVGEEAASKIDEVKNKTYFAYGSDLADMCQVLETLGIKDANRVMHNKDYSKTLFNLSANKDQKSWSAGFISHHVGDEVCRDFGLSCGVDPWSWGNPDSSIFEFYNDVSAHCKLNHGAVSIFTYYPDLIRKAYKVRGGTHEIPNWKIDSAAAILLAGQQVEAAIISCGGWPTQEWALDHPCHCLDWCGWHPCTSCRRWPCWMWKCVHDGWQTKYNFAVGQSVREVKALYAAEVCNDSDGGKNWHEKGRVEAPDGIFEDDCLSNGNLLEYYCNEDKRVDSVEHQCDYKCAFGRCISKKEGYMEIMALQRESEETPVTLEQVNIDRIRARLEELEKSAVFSYEKFKEDLDTDTRGLLDKNIVTVNYLSIEDGGRKAEIEISKPEEWKSFIEAKQTVFKSITDTIERQLQAKIDEEEALAQKKLAEKKVEVPQEVPEAIPVPEKVVPKEKVSKITEIVRVEETPGIWAIDEEGAKHPIPDKSVFESHELKWEEVKEVTQTELDKYPQKEALKLAENTLVKTPSSPEIYKVEQEKLRQITSPEVFEEKGYSWDKVITVPEKLLAEYEKGKEIKPEEEFAFPFKLPKISELIKLGQRLFLKFIQLISKVLNILREK